MKPNILIVGNIDIGEIVKENLPQFNCIVHSLEAAELHEDYDVLLTALTDEHYFLQVVETSRAKDPNIPIILYTFAPEKSIQQVAPLVDDIIRKHQLNNFDDYDKVAEVIQKWLDKS